MPYPVINITPPRYDEVYIDLFAGPGGWDTGILPLGIAPLGVEWDEDAANTARAAGHNRTVADVALLNPLTFTLARVIGLIASPPCQGFSIGGKGLGRKDSQMLLDGIRRLVANPTGAAVDALIAELAGSMHDPRSLLVLQPLRWTLYMRPDWIAWEQVPAVQALWAACAEVLTTAGYTVDTGVLNAEQYGVPQTRRRAILVGRSAQFSAIHGPAALPEPTHSRFHSRTPSRIDEGVPRWVTMADALGWGMTNRPYPTVSTGTSAGGTDPLALGGTQGRSIVYSAREAGAWVEKTWKDSPDRWDIKRRWTPGVDGRDLVMPLRPVAVDDELDAADGQGATRNDGVRVTPQEAGVLQSFPADYPWSGGKSAQYRQASDAVPPLLARAVVAAVSGASMVEGVGAGVATVDAAA